MPTNWIVLADAARAKVCQRDADTGRVVKLAEFVHPDSRRKGSELAGARPGHVAAGHGGSGGSARLEPRSDPQRKEHAVFARELAQYVDRALADGRCAGWVLVASNPFLGELKAHLGASATSALLATHATDLTAFTGPELEHHLSEVLARR
jgi:protein required for attachment to host cells